MAAKGFGICEGCPRWKRTAPTQDLGMPRESRCSRLEECDRIVNPPAPRRWGHAPDLPAMPQRKGPK